MAAALCLIACSSRSARPPTIANTTVKREGDSCCQHLIICVIHLFGNQLTKEIGPVTWLKFGRVSDVVRLKSLDLEGIVMAYPSLVKELLDTSLVSYIIWYDIHQSINLSNISLSIHQSIFLSIYLSIHWYIHQNLKWSAIISRQWRRLFIDSALIPNKQFKIKSLHVNKKKLSINKLSIWNI